MRSGRTKCSAQVKTELSCCLAPSRHLERCGLVRVRKDLHSAMPAMLVVMCVYGTP